MITRSRLLDLCAFAAYFVIAAYIGRLTVISGSEVALVWPVAGVAAAWMAVTGWQRSLIVDVGAMLVLSWALYLLVGLSGGVAFAVAVASVGQTLVFGLLISRWCPTWWGFGSEPPPGVERLRDLGALMAASVAAAFASALIGAGPVVFIADADWMDLASWVTRNSVGIIAIFPLSLLARNAARARTPGSPPAAVGPYRGSGIELVGLVLVTLGVGWLIFGINDNLPIPFLLLATSVWAGTRFSPWIADLHALLLVTGVVVATVLDSGPFAYIDEPSAETLVVQAYVAVVVVLTLALSVGRRESLGLHQRLAASELAAKQQAGMMRTILDTMTDGVSVVDGAGGVVLRNPAARRLVGNIVIEDSGRLDVAGFDLLYADGTPVTAADAPMVQALAGEPIGPVDVLFRNPTVPDGRLVEVSGRPIVGSDPPLVVVVFHDVTSDRRERDELASFAGVVAHDLLNPLTVVEGWSESLLEAARAGIVVPPARQADQLERIQRAAQRMQNLISDLLSYTTARDLTITLVRCDLQALAQDIARSRAEASRVREEAPPIITIAPDLPDVLAEPVLLRQVMDNLVGNAVKYVAPGVRPEIAISGRTVAGEEGAMVEVVISDNGIGIPEGQHARVFETFHRVHLDGYRGTGLGLSIVKRVAERHGGQASARDNDGTGGTTMTVSFPAAERGVMANRRQH